MHGPSTIKILNGEIERPRADIRLVHSQGEFIAIPQTSKGADFIDKHYAHAPEVLGGRRISSEERMALLAGRAEAFGITIR